MDKLTIDKLTMDMDFRPPEAWKPLATELSALLRSGNKDGERMRRLFKELTPARDAGEPGKSGERGKPGEAGQSGETGDTRQTAPPFTPAESRTGSHIGIWEKRLKEGRTHYYRDPKFQPEWAQWAYVHHIGPRTGKRRIVLLGESVARGYLYDPYYNVAMELEALLNARTDLKDTEVIDLARVSMQMNGLMEVIASCTALEPDLVIIFAGNNWTQDLPALLKSGDNIAQLFHQKGIKGIQSLVESNFEKELDTFFQTVNHSLLSKKIPVLFILPEFNLKDWRSDEIEQGLLVLPDNHTVRWLEARDLTAKAKNNSNLHEWEKGACAMLEEDYFNPLGHEWMGELHVVNREWPKARECFRMARDLALYRGGAPTPRCTAFVRRKILSCAGAYGIGVVDLPAIFEECIAEGIPDRHLFLDYCHLSVEGIKIAMRYTAQKILEIWGGTSPHIQTIKASTLRPKPEVTAIAHFAAAIHNAHYGQSAEIVQFHCQQSIDQSPAVADLMECFMDFSTRYTPTLYCSQFGKIIMDGKMRQYEGGLKLAHQKGHKLMDTEIVDILAARIEKIKPGMTGKIQSLRISEHGVGSQPVELTESYYSAAGYNEFRLAPKSSFLRARTLTTRFFFVIQPHTQTLNFSLTYRNPRREEGSNPRTVESGNPRRVESGNPRREESGIPQTAPTRILRTEEDSRLIRIGVNDPDSPVAEARLSRNWTTLNFSLDARGLPAGINKLFIQWPYTAGSYQPNPSGSSKDLVERIYPVFGEIYVFTVQACPEPI